MSGRRRNQCTHIEKESDWKVKNDVNNKSNDSLVARTVMIQSTKCFHSSIGSFSKLRKVLVRICGGLCWGNRSRYIDWRTCVSSWKIFDTDMTSREDCAKYICRSLRPWWSASRWARSRVDVSLKNEFRVSVHCRADGDELDCWTGAVSAYSCSDQRLVGDCWRVVSK